MKIFYMGKELKPRKYVRKENGEFTEYKRTHSKLWLVAIALVLYSGVSLFTTENVVTYVAAQEPLKAIDHTPEKIEALKAKVVDTLLACESAGHKEDEGIIRYDNNAAGTLTGKNVFSLGQLQWKVSTIQTFVKQRDGKAITQKEAVLIALDSAAARELAQWVIFETDRGIFHWYVCSQKHNLAAKVEIIKELSS